MIKKFLIISSYIFFYFGCYSQNNDTLKLNNDAYIEFSDYWYELKKDTLFVKFFPDTTIEYLVSEKGEIVDSIVNISNQNYRHYILKKTEKGIYIKWFNHQYSIWDSSLYYSFTDTVRIFDLTTIHFSQPSFNGYSFFVEDTIININGVNYECYLFKEIFVNRGYSSLSYIDINFSLPIKRSIYRLNSNNKWELTVDNVIEKFYLHE